MRKLRLCICLFCSTLWSHAERADSAKPQLLLDSLSKRGTLLSEGWVYHTGDDINYADPTLNDQGWKPVNPTLAVPDLPADMQSGMGWLRLKFKVVPGLKRSAAIMLKQAVAVEIYLNGKLIGKRGTIDAATKNGTNYQDRINPVELPLLDTGVQVLAIRYAHQQNMQFIGRYALPPFFFARFTNTTQLVNSIAFFKNTDLSLSVAMGILVLLGLLHLIFLKYNPEQRANLYFACYAWLFALFLFGSTMSTYSQPMDRQVYTVLLNVALYISSTLFAIKALYSLFRFDTRWHLKALIPLSIVAGVIGLFDEHSDALPVIFVILLLTTVQLVLTVKAVRCKRRGALIVAAGFFVSLIGVFIYMYIIFSFQSTPELPFIFATSLAMLGPPLGISFFLGREFALDSQLLQYKLREVKELSAKSIAQEQEKQELLASQNEILEQQVQERTLQLSQSLSHLQQTQDQLIQAEKMASLGELTAGIAHEIQNPLNFVNNFAEVSQELIDEMQAELQNGEPVEAMAIAADIKQNLEKIYHHGQRANFIVKGMLQHSQISTTKHQPENINLLIEEYSKLAYNGFRAKNNSFTAAVTKKLDTTIPKVQIASQEIGRVLLNIFSNALYALYEQQKKAGAGYLPELKISTTVIAESVEIRITDNGTGIPAQLIDKIMQPFFTTKPTGEGTGLGLSLSYDIVVKGHGGQLHVASEEGKGTTFMMLLPLSQV